MTISNVQSPLKILKFHTHHLCKKKFKHFTVMESTKLKIQQNALLVSRGHKVLQQFKIQSDLGSTRQGTAAAAPGPQALLLSQLPAMMCRVSRRRFSCWNMKYRLPFSRVRLARAPGCSAPCSVLLGCLHQAAPGCTDCGHTESTVHLEKSWVWPCKCSGKHGQGSLKTPNTWGNIKPLLGTP